jgi:hypothetical protein
LDLAAKKSGCEDISHWIRSASNHAYWVAASSGDDGDMKLDKWRSLLNHVRDKHTDHGGQFPRCLHGPLDDADDRMWLKDGKIILYYTVKYVIFLRSSV